MKLSTAMLSKVSPTSDTTTTTDSKPSGAPGVGVQLRMMNDDLCAAAFSA